MKRADATPKRLRLRVIARDQDSRIIDIREQEIPADPREIGLFLRRDPCRESAAHALLLGGSITIERSK